MVLSYPQAAYETSGPSISMALSLSVATIGLRGQRIPEPPHVAEIVPATVSVSDVSGKTVYLTEGDLSRLPPQTVNAIDYGMPTTFEGVLLKDVLAKADAAWREFPPHSGILLFGGGRQGRIRCRFLLGGTQFDRYGRSVVRRHEARWKAISAMDGPFQLVVPGRNERWVRQLTGLKIQQMK